jgi:hypothetical protein
MIVRLFLASATLLMLNLKAFGYTAVSVYVDQRERIYFYTFSGYDVIDVQEKALTVCPTECRLYYVLNGTAAARQCLGIVVRASSPPKNSIYHAWAATGSKAISDAEEKCKAAGGGPSCVRRQFVCDPQGADGFFQVEPADFTIKGSDPTTQGSFFDRHTIAEMIDYIRDDLKLRKALVLYSVAFGFGMFALLCVHDIVAHDRRSMRRMALNLVMSCAVAAGTTGAGLVMPAIWGWILSLETAAVVLLATVISGMTLLLIPRQFWRTLKHRNTFGRTSLSEGPEDLPAAKDPRAKLDKKAIKEAALRSRKEEFDL